MGDEDIVQRLVTVRGVGRWTAEMLLIFRLGRPDVLPANDYGVRHGFMLAYRKRSMPSPAELVRAGEKWRPFRTAASWYLWRAVDAARQERQGRRSSK
jgi:3-methyladenine DNA glycosylase/8-oxoguanine DNA glycosylase